MTIIGIIILALIIGVITRKVFDLVAVAIVLVFGYTIIAVLWHFLHWIIIVSAAVLVIWFVVYSLKISKDIDKPMTIGTEIKKDNQKHDEK